MNSFLGFAKDMAKTVFGNKKEYIFKFNHEDDGNWYFDFPGWPFSHHNLMMVAGADKLVAGFSKDDKQSVVNLIPVNEEEEHPDYAKLTRMEYSITGGATYEVSNLKGFNQDIWLCPVTLFALGEYPKYIYMKAIN